MRVVERVMVFVSRAGVPKVERPVMVPEQHWVRVRCRNLMIGFEKGRRGSMCCPMWVRIWQMDRAFPAQETHDHFCRIRQIAANTFSQPTFVSDMPFSNSAFYPNEYKQLITRVFHFDRQFYCHI
jgi:hypothetical protein